MDEQLTFEFAERPTIKGFPELRWTGKRPYRSITVLSSTVTRALWRGNERMDQQDILGR